MGEDHRRAELAKHKTGDPGQLRRKLPRNRAEPTILTWLHYLVWFSHLQVGLKFNLRHLDFASSSDKMIWRRSTEPNLI